MKTNQRLIILQPKVRLIDPHINTDDRNTLSPLLNIFETLVVYGKDGMFHGSLAHKWEVSPDARKWTFHIRKSVSFHHGEKLTSDDVVASINRILNPDADGELATRGIFHGYLGNSIVEKLDDYSLCVSNPDPIADMLDFLVRFPITPRSLNQELPEKMSGTGPFQLIKHTQDRIEMSAFENYWGGSPAVKNVIWEAEPDPQRRVEALFSGQVDLISNFPPALIGEIQQRKGFSIANIESSICTVFMCNHTRGVCSDRRVRQALNYGLDKTELIQKIMNGAAYPLNGPLTKLHFGYNPETPVYPCDLNKARALLFEAGYPDNLELVLDVPLTLPDEARSLAHHMAEQYQRIGIHTIVKEFPDRTEYAHIVRNKQIDDACCFDSSPLSTYQVLSDKFHSGLHGAWWQGYQNRKVDELIDQARSTPDNSKRQTLYHNVYQLLNEDAPWIFLHNPVLLWGIGPNAQGWQPNYQGLILLN